MTANRPATNPPATPPPKAQVPTPNPPIAAPTAPAAPAAPSAAPAAKPAAKPTAVPGVKAMDLVATEADIRGFDLPGFIKTLLQAGTPKAMKIGGPDLRALLTLAHDKYASKKTPLIECRAPINICGDTHGQYNDLLRIFNACGPATTTKYLFLGDYIDRGRHSLEVICLLFALKLALPKNVYLLRGNHELKAINKNYGFYAELRMRMRESQSTEFFESVYNKFNQIFSYMPLAAVVSKRILCMHGGISPKLTSLDDIRNIPLPLETAKSHPLACDLLWADPDANATDFIFNKTRAISHVFGEKQVHDMCAKLDIDMIVRAHQVVEFGYAFFASRRLITVFSASRYQEEMHNYAAVVLVSNELEVSFVQLKPEEFERRREETGPDVKEQTTTNVPNLS